ncbi:MAG: ferrous iron transport protein A [Ignavibacteria bacterium]|jgi:Fe2+ transport system protein FeoA
MRLESIPVGSRCRILEIQGEGGAVRRAKELGLIHGVICMVVRKAPFSGPIEVATPLAHIGVRPTEDLVIIVEPVAALVSEAA